MRLQEQGKGSLSLTAQEAARASAYLMIPASLCNTEGYNEDQLIPALWCVVLQLKNTEHKEIKSLLWEDTDTIYIFQGCKKTCLWLHKKTLSLLSKVVHSINRLEKVVWNKGDRCFWFQNL